MDTTQITHLSLCAGYGGIDLGLRRVISNLRTVAYAEIEAFACENLLARMEGGQLDAAPIWSDLKTFPWEQFSGLVDILTGGYPCQPFSSAGKRLGTEDERHLWPYIASGIRILKPRVCFFENVEGHISLGLSTVISDLEELGYTVSWGIFSASECGAPHQRKRVFILAHRIDPGLQGRLRRWQDARRKSEYGHTGRGSGSICGGRAVSELADANSAGSGQDWESSELRADSTEQSSCPAGRGDAGEIREEQAWPSRPGQPQHDWEPPRVVGNAPGGTRLGRASGDERHAAQSDEAGGKRQVEPAVGGDTDGLAGGMDYAELCVSCDNRTDELRLLGNGVVPATAAKAFITLLHDLDTNIPRECGL